MNRANGRPRGRGPRKIIARGPIEITQRVIKFGSDTALIPGQIIDLLNETEAAGWVVQVESVGENLRCRGRVIAFLHGPDLARRPDSLGCRAKS